MTTNKCKTVINKTLQGKCLNMNVFIFATEYIKLKLPNKD